MNKTQIIAEKDKQEMFIIREFDAAREDVFKAFTTPNILVQFLAPDNHTMNFHYHDYKTGGRYSWYHQDGDGKTVCTFNGVIHELLPSERLIQTSEFMEHPEKGHPIMEYFSFEELPNGRTKLIIQEVCKSLADRDAMVESGMADGLVQMFEKLDTLLKKEPRK